ncbi:MAG: hypothetical protein H7144_07685 [Burkholderiales bacterium]|nr:hypothetical protein [Phycisphaerae bacterium]
MQKTITMTFGGAIAVALMLGALYAWFNAADRALSSDHPDVLRWAARSLAVAAAAGAQVVALWLVVGRMYENRTFNLGLRFVGAVVCCVAVVAAAAFGWAARG